MKGEDPEVTKAWLAEARRQWREFEGGKVEVQPGRSSSESASVKPAILDSGADILDASLPYELEREGPGYTFLREVEEAIQQIKNWPVLFQVLEPPHRGCLLDRFPYRLIYRDEASYVYIVSVVHQSRHPGCWQERLKHLPE